MAFQSLISYPFLGSLLIIASSLNGCSNHEQTESVPSLDAAEEHSAAQSESQSQSNLVGIASEADIQALLRQLETLPESETQRFILTMQQAIDFDTDLSATESAVGLLEASGAEQIETLSDLPIIIVTSERGAVEAAVKAGLIKHVQIDRLSRPYQQ